MGEGLRLKKRRHFRTAGKSFAKFLNAHEKKHPEFKKILAYFNGL